MEEFDAGMNPEEYLRGVPIMVKGKEVRLNPNHINNYFGTELPDDPELLAEMNDGVSWDDLYVHQNVNFANELVIEPIECWVALHYPIKHSNLKADLGQWNIFISNSLKPYIVAMGKKMSEYQPLIFPCLIIEFYRRCGVDFKDDPFDPAPYDNGIATLNSLLVERDPTSGPTIDPNAVEFWAAIEISLREFEEKGRAELDLKQKEPKEDDRVESSDEE
ncbi:hypothetical protein Ddye_023362 [Dipteronia dyeriana]|uniref:Uncharacterized protein n=1 Tax=Dipteronia dyeriana TaxID=168575 RepID=A0AAD9TTS4_9ROSI|nr:hypothetical protein Ddye_023362 [Dipteronia dyeriana]